MILVLQFEASERELRLNQLFNLETYSTLKYRTNRRHYGSSFILTRYTLTILQMKLCFIDQHVKIQITNEYGRNSNGFLGKELEPHSCNDEKDSGYTDSYPSGSICNPTFLVSTSQPTHRAGVDHGCIAGEWMPFSTRLFFDATLTNTFVFLTLFSDIDNAIRIVNDVIRI